jgi:hypothetical protein
MTRENRELKEKLAELYLEGGAFKETRGLAMPAQKRQYPQPVICPRLSDRENAIRPEGYFCCLFFAASSIFFLKLSGLISVQTSLM